MRENSSHCSFTIHFFYYFLSFWFDSQLPKLALVFCAMPVADPCPTDGPVWRWGRWWTNLSSLVREAVIWTLLLSSGREVLSYAGRFCLFATDSLTMAKEKKKGELRAEQFGCFNLISRNTWLSLTHIFALLSIAAGLVKEPGQVHVPKSWQAFNWDSYGMKVEGQALKCIMTDLGEKHVFPHTNCILSAQSSRWAHQQKYFGCNSLSNAMEVSVHGTLGLCGF